MAAIYHTKEEPEELWARMRRTDKHLSKGTVLRVYHSEVLPGLSIYFSNPPKDYIVEGLKLKLVFERALAAQLTRVK